MNAVEDEDVPTHDDDGSPIDPEQWRAFREWFKKTHPELEAKRVAAESELAAINKQEQEDYEKYLVDQNITESAQDPAYGKHLNDKNLA